MSHLNASCKNVGTWPVLVGEEGQCDTLLSSPIILYDYPQIAPESAGDLFDGTEIDEILSLRIMTLTDDEKREMSQSDERARQMLERTETMPVEQLMKLHGVLRGRSSPGHLAHPRRRPNERVGMAAPRRENSRRSSGDFRSRSEDREAACVCAPARAAM